MGNGGGTAARRNRSSVAALGIIVVVAVSLTLVVGLPSSASAAAWVSGYSTEWSNGLVLCQFAPSTPSVAVSAVSVSNSGLSVSVVNITEVSPGGAPIAVAELNGASWTAVNRSTEYAFDLSYSANVPITLPAGRPTVGSASVTVDFVLPAYQGSAQGSWDTVDVVLDLSVWAWQAPNDHLVVTLGATPAVSGTERLGLSEQPGWLLGSTSESSGSELERLGTNTTAAATSAAGSTQNIAANSTVALASPDFANVTVSFGTTAGEFAQLTFTSRVGVILPPTVAGVPLPELVAAAVGAGIVSIAVAAVTRRLRGRPSKLIYADSEEDR